MGFRTVVILYNDQASTWENDPTLGKKIAHGMNFATIALEDATASSPANLGFGRVVECAHADTQRVAVLDSYNFTTVATSFWRSDEKTDDRNVRLLKEAADKLGYRLVKKSK